MPMSALDAYDEQNVFARILRGEIPARMVFDDEYAFAINDISPQAAVHVLVMPKGPYRSFDDFVQLAPPDRIAGFFRAVAAVAKQFGLVESGYRILANHGLDSGQEVAHFHVHLLGGQALGRIVDCAKAHA